MGVGGGLCGGGGIASGIASKSDILFGKLLRVLSGVLTSSLLDAGLIPRVLSSICLFTSSG